MLEQTIRRLFVLTMSLLVLVSIVACQPQQVEIEKEVIVEKIVEVEKGQVTIIDDDDRAVTINLPIESFVYHGHNSYLYETLRAIGVDDKIIGVANRFTTEGGSRYSPAYFPDLIGMTNVGLLKEPDYEVVSTLRPDVVISDEGRFYDHTKTPDIPVIFLDVRLASFRDNTMKYGYLFDKVEEAEKYINWFNTWADELKSRTADIADEDKPLVYIGYYSGVQTGEEAFQVPARDNYRNAMVTMAGGNGMGNEIMGHAKPKVSTEWIITRNPDVMIFSTTTDYVGYDKTDPAEVKALMDEFLSRPEFVNVNAVKNKRVYFMPHSFLLDGGGSGLLGTLYYAKWIYPDLFADINPQEIHQDYVTTFQRLDLNVSDLIMTYEAE